MEIAMYIIVFLVSAVIFSFIGYIVRKKSAESKIQSAETEAQRILDNAQKEAENAKKEEIVKAKEQILNSRNELEEEIRERRSDIQLQEKRLLQKEENLEKKLYSAEQKERQLDKKEEDIEKERIEVQKLKDSQLDELERIARLSVDEAKQQLLAKVDEKLTTEKVERIKKMEEDIKEKSEETAKNVITYAIQKCAADHTSESTVSIVALPNDDMKGRIIGREGRNIRALETLTGVDFVIDDGRIHPAKIEEMVEKAKEEVAKTIKEEGERAVMETGVMNLHPDLIKLLGKLKYRTSYGQNVLNHSIEVSNLARIMADELGLDTKLARRAGLLHDIGKALDHDMEGTHVEIGVEILKKYKEDPKVINAVQAHHGDVEPQTPEAYLVQAADAISASRPGARRETLDAYIKRLEQLESIADSFDGVEKSYAIQAGREIRIIVKPEKVSDDEMTIMARKIAEKVENEMDYPGQIKINMIREKRVIDYAK